MYCQCCKRTLTDTGALPRSMYLSIQQAAGIALQGYGATPLPYSPPAHFPPPIPTPSQGRPPFNGSFVWLSAGVPELQNRLSATLPSRHTCQPRAFATIYFSRRMGSQSFDNRFAMHDHRLTLHDNRLPCPLPRLPARLAQGRRFVEVPRRLLLRRWRHRWLRQRGWRRSI